MLLLGRKNKFPHEYVTFLTENLLECGTSLVFAKNGNNLRLQELTTVNELPSSLLKQSIHLSFSIPAS